MFGFESVIQLQKELKRERGEEGGEKNQIVVPQTCLQMKKGHIPERKENSNPLQNVYPLFIFYKREIRISHKKKKNEKEIKN